jgi:hypothetical protein
MTMAWESQRDWDEREAAAIAETKAAFALQREQEQHSRDCEAYAAFAQQRAEQARKRGHRGDDLVAQTWTDEAARIAQGECTSSKIIRSDYEVNQRFGSLRTRLAYEGKMFAKD